MDYDTLIGVLEQETELQPTEIMMDTAGYTDTIFGGHRQLNELGGEGRVSAGHVDSP